MTFAPARPGPMRQASFWTPGESVAYHAPCHLRAQAGGFRGRDLLRKIPGVDPQMTLECCGHDGTYAMTVEGFEASQRVGQRAFDGMREDAAAETWVTDCPLAALQFEQHAGQVIGTGCRETLLRARVHVWHAFVAFASLRYASR